MIYFSGLPDRQTRTKKRHSNHLSVHQSVGSPCITTVDLSSRIICIITMSDSYDVAHVCHFCSLKTWLPPGIGKCASAFEVLRSYWEKGQRCYCWRGRLLGCAGPSRWRFSGTRSWEPRGWGPCEVCELHGSSGDMQCSPMRQPVQVNHRWQSVPNMPNEGLGREDDPPSDFDGEGVGRIDVDEPELREPCCTSWCVVFRKINSHDIVLQCWCFALMFAARDCERYESWVFAMTSGLLWLFHGLALPVAFEM